MGLEGVETVEVVGVIKALLHFQTTDVSFKEIVLRNIVMIGE